VSARPGTFTLHSDLPILLAPGAGDADFASARELARSAAQLGVQLPIETHARTDDLPRCIELRREGAAGEAYRIRVDPRRIEAVGSGPAGLRYAVETLKQLLRPTRRVPACVIDDAPDLPLRGIMLDVSRGKVPSAATLKELVDRCVQLKLNVLMLYTEHTFRFRRHPQIGAGASPLDAETLRDLDAYAAQRHVDLIPTLQSLGHMERVLALPAYRRLDESGRGWTLSPAEPGTYDLLRDLYDEYLPNFRSRWFNANCDEPYDLGQGKSKAHAARSGVASVYLEHVRRVRDLARSHGKQTMIWGDFVHQHPERIPELDRDLVLLDWWYEAEFDYDRVKTFGDNGIAFLVCPGTSSWNCLFPRIENSLLNIARWAQAGKRHGARGLVCTDWGDYGHYNLLGNSWLGYAWSAQHAWAGEAAAADFDRAFGRVLFSEESRVAARCYRELGAIHEVGFPTFNASPIQFLYFDDLDRAFFVQATRPALLRRNLRRLARVRGRILGAARAFAGDPLTRDELLYAADASIHALRKGLVGREWVAWRRRPARLDGHARRRLARECAQLAAEQRALARRLERLWLARSAPSNFEITRRRLEGSIRSLRRAARALERNRPPPAPPTPGDFNPASVVAVLRESVRAASQPR
jgi:hypothetical protein